MKIGIVGSGFVGATAAYAMVMRGVGRQIVLVDVNQDRARAEADDLNHAVPFSEPLHVQSGSYHDLVGSRVVVITAGANQRPGETRLDLLKRNALIIRDIVPQVLDYAPEAILLVASNPVDGLTHMAAKVAGQQRTLPGRVLGTGTTLDTARFRTLLARHVGVDAQHIHAYVIGEHGDSEVLTWSLVTIGGIPLEEFCRLRNLTVCSEDRQEIDDQVRNAAYRIIAGKGATYYGIGSAIARIVDVILRDQRAILTVCAPMEEVGGVKDVTLALPHLVGGQGSLTTLQLPLDESEQAALHNSAQIVRKAIDQIENRE
jgi:L-lactate dehydrogenase